MPFSDQLSLWAEDGTSSEILLNRLPSSDPFTSIFETADGIYKAEIRQKSTKARKRHEIVVTKRKIATDPLTAVLSEVSASAGFFVDEPKIGFTDEELHDLARTIVMGWATHTAVFPLLVQGMV